MAMVDMVMVMVMVLLRDRAMVMVMVSPGKAEGRAHRNSWLCFCNF